MTAAYNRLPRAEEQGKMTGVSQICTRKTSAIRSMRQRDVFTAPGPTTRTTGVDV
jgi:hypothetical protein